MESYTTEMVVGGRVMSLETGRLARQANGAVVVRYGETVVLVTAVASRDPRPGIDFFPLTVDFEERLYAVGKIPGGYNQTRRPAERASHFSRAAYGSPDSPVVSCGISQRCTYCGKHFVRRPRSFA